MPVYDLIDFNGRLISQFNAPSDTEAARMAAPWGTARFFSDDSGVPLAPYTDTPEPDNVTPLIGPEVFPIQPLQTWTVNLDNPELSEPPPEQFAGNTDVVVSRAPQEGQDGLAALAWPIAGVLGFGWLLVRLRKKGG